MLSQLRNFFIGLRQHYISYGRHDNDIFEVKDVNLLQLGFVLIDIRGARSFESLDLATCGRFFSGWHS